MFVNTMAKSAKDRPSSMDGSARNSMSISQIICTGSSHDSSLVSSITLDDALLPRFDSKLESLKEQKWAANPNLGELIESFGDHLRLPRNNFKRFSESTHGTDKALCEKPRRVPSLDSFYIDKSSCSSIQNLSHTSQTSIISDYRSSKSVLPPASFFLEEEEEEEHGFGVTRTKEETGKDRVYK